jgi:hypothetical protein
MARVSRGSIVLTLVLAWGALSAAQAPVAQPVLLTPEQMETFLATAKIVRERDAPKGVTDTVRATLSDGAITHDAQFQTIDEAKAIFEAGRATEINFKDTYRYNIAGYRLAQLLGMTNVPMSVQRRYKGKDSAVTWWVDDVMFDESGRVALTNRMGPDPDRTQKQIQVMYVFDELIQNRDRNQGNLQWTKDWTLWLIDHTRAFRLGNELLRPERLVRCERGLLERLKQLTEASVTEAMKGILTKGEIEPILKRRDLIVQHFEKLIATRGESNVLFSL